MLCPKCSQELPEGSAFCNHCGANLNAQPEPTHETQPSSSAAPIPPTSAAIDPKKKQRKTLIIVGAVLLALALLIVSPGIRAAKDRPSKPNIKQAVTVFADDVLKAYAENEVQADSLYKKKTLFVTGVVSSVSSTSVNKNDVQIMLIDMNTYLLALTSTYNTRVNDNIMAYFKTTAKTQQALAALKKGDMIAIYGYFSGADDITMYKQLRLWNCTFIKIDSNEAQ